MGRINSSGMKIQCGHCGYTWFYNGDNAVTSCPQCGWRVRISAPRRFNQPSSNALITEHKRDRLI